MARPDPGGEKRGKKDKEAGGKCELLLFFLQWKGMGGREETSRPLASEERPLVTKGGGERGEMDSLIPLPPEGGEDSHIMAIKKKRQEEKEEGKGRTASIRCSLSSPILPEGEERADLRPYQEDAGR